MLILGIETALSQGLVFLGEGEKVLTSYRLPAHSSERLAPTIRSLMDEFDVTFNRLGGVVVSVGPGSFTGIRVGVSLAKSISYCLKIPLVGVPTLDLLAFAAPCSGVLCSLIEGYGECLFAAFFEKEGDEKPKKKSDYLFLHLEDIVNEAKKFFPKKVIFVGFSKVSPNILETKFQFSLFDAPLHLERALLRWGRKNIEAKILDDPLILTPIYVSPPRIKKRKDENER